MKRSDIKTREVLIACHRFHNGETDLAPYKTLMKDFNAPEKVVYAAMEREENKGLIECGVSLRTSWVTELGYDYLQKNG